MNQLLLGIGRAIITPKIGAALCGYAPDHFSESINDDLTVTAFYFQAGSTNALMITATVCEIQTALCDRLRAELASLFNIPSECIVLCATHTHSGPNLMGQYGWGDIDREYLETVFRPRLHEAVREALASPQPVRMGVGVGNSFVGINRREITKDGQVVLGQNPWAPFDSKMTVLSFIGEDGKCVANIIHYGAHGTGAGKNVEISRDWSGVMTDRLESESGGITAFFNGPEGDVGPRLTNGKTTGNLQMTLELGGVAAQDAIRIYNTIRAYIAPELTLVTKDTSVPLSPRIPLAEARAEYEKYKEYTVNSLAAKKEHYRQIVASYENGESDEEFFCFPQTLIRIGGVIFTSYPYELFSEIGLRIAHEIKNAHVLALSNANGADGYFVTEDQICRGGYEVDMFLNGRPQGYRPASDTHLVLEVLKNIDALKQERD
ncbi:MAG: neutral/alkaline non-lysosomal ceramidase N-terminal domain-containing protein [Clostridia bacterium]|nr:neutral/alkaline non-lysosomal ceramidase N-terminal domain-containing protein [Clostridia bacterium]